MSKLFKKESQFKENNLSASKIKEERNKEDYLKIIKELDDYILTIKCDNNELLSKAVKYYLNHKDELYTFLECGYVDISNNLAERVVKVFVIAFSILEIGGWDFCGILVTNWYKIVRFVITSNIFYVL